MEGRGTFTSAGYTARAGERDPAVLLELCDVRIRKVKAERVLELLRGEWADEHLFALGLAVQSWDHYQAQTTDCDRRIEAVLAQMPGVTGRRLGWKSRRSRGPDPA